MRDSFRAGALFPDARRHKQPHTAVRLICAAAFVFATLSQVGGAASTVLPAWVMEAPPGNTQYEKSTQDRSLNPCNVPDPGFREYGPWKSALPGAYVTIPRQLPPGITSICTLSGTGRTTHTSHFPATERCFSFAAAVRERLKIPPDETGWPR